MMARELVLCLLWLPPLLASPPAVVPVLWYRQPAALRTEALPLGNGRLGALIFGGVAEGCSSTRIQCARAWRRRTRYRVAGKKSYASSASHANRRRTRLARPPLGQEIASVSQNGKQLQLSRGICGQCARDCWRERVRGCVPVTGDGVLHSTVSTAAPRMASFFRALSAAFASDIGNCCVSVWMGIPAASFRNSSPSCLVLLATLRITRS